jgi:DNA modification methylase
MTNNPAIQIGNNKVYSGHNLDVLKHLPNNSIDSIVTDPPYELGFMSKTWDKSGIAYSVELWQECLRVLKPGGHLLAFGGTRTWHRLAVAIEDAGFEIRDNIAWLYGSGFPKSHNISKAIDKRGGQGTLLTQQIGEALKEARQKRNITKTQADQMFCEGTTNWTWFEGRPAGQRPPTPETFSRIVTAWPELAELAELVAEAQREVIGQYQTDMGGLGGQRLGQANGNITVSATDDAKAWDGWGTALKPAHEPIVVARKPLIGTVAENVLKYGTGGLNIDASRIGTGTGEKKIVNYPDIRGNNYGQDNEAYAERATVEREVIDQGRWPANIILDETTAELLDQQSGQVKGGTWNNTAGARHFNNNGEPTNYVSKGADNSVGGASRFFYVAKASKKDRNEGLDQLPKIQMEVGDERPSGNSWERRGKQKAQPRQNIHPTVKPTSLMTYLIKLVTPANGVVLDPFTGSGSTGKAAILEGYKFIGIELTAEYLPIIAGRLQHAYDTYNNKTDDLFE